MNATEGARAGQGGCLRHAARVRCGDGQGAAAWRARSHRHCIAPRCGAQGGVVGAAGVGAGHIAGKLMHGLVLQPVIPSTHAEYLGITYFEVSNADRSSALGLRLNQQNKTNNNNKIIILCDMSNVICAICTVRPER